MEPKKGLVVCEVLKVKDNLSLFIFTTECNIPGVVQLDCELQPRGHPGAGHHRRRPQGPRQGADSGLGDPAQDCQQHHQRGRQHGGLGGELGQSCVNYTYQQTFIILRTP